MSDSTVIPAAAVPEGTTSEHEPEASSSATTLEGTDADANANADVDDAEHDADADPSPSTAAATGTSDPAAPAPTAVATAEPRVAGGYDPSVPADEMVAPGGYDPSVPADEMVAPGGYDPSVPADEMAAPGVYDPSVPADEMNAAAASAGSGGYDPSVPADEMLSGAGGYDPSAPTDEKETAEAAGSYDPSIPAEEMGAASYDASVPAREVEAQGADFAAPPPTSVYDSNPAEGIAPEQETDDPQVDEAKAPDAEMKVGLPEGLTEESPSVVANPQLVRQYRQSSYMLSLFNWSIQKTEVVDARAWYEVLAVENPTASQPMLALINLELALSNFVEVEALFARSLGSSSALMAAPNINLWKAYLHYVRRQNSSDAEKARSVVTQAYDYALKECGIDRESGELWQEYIHYVAEPRSKNPWDIQQQNDTLRKLYQRAVAIPLNNVEVLWKAYDAFESVQNKQTAKKFLAERSPAYMTARTAFREMRGLTDVLPHPVIPPMPQYTDNDRRVVGAWRAYLKWEESDPLNTDDESLVVQRVSYALKKCMGQMRHFPELWHYAASYHMAGGRTEEAVAFLKAGVAACPKSFLLTFALAEAEEDRKEYAECHKIFKSLIQHLDTEIEELSAKVTVEVEVARGPEIPIANPDMDLDAGDDTDIGRLIRERDERGKLVQERRGKDIHEVKTAAGIVWVMYMRFARRAEGLIPARDVFRKARKSANITWQVFEASALMEYRSNKDQPVAVAVRIFELGFKLFSEDVGFVMSYLNFLLSINDDTNARALFERSALKIPADKARPLWDAWARFEYMYGDLTAVHKLETRFTEAFPKDTPLKRFAARYAYNGIDEIALRDLGFGRSRADAAPAPAPPPLVRVGVGPDGGALPPFPPPNAPGVAAAAVRGGMSPMRNSPQKRALSPPRSPARGDAFKRARGQSPPPPTGRPAYGPNQGRSPVPPIRPPVPAARVPPTAPAAGPSTAAVPPALSWFIGRLPSTRTFDGPIFRADDIIGLFSNIPATGAAAGGPPSASHAPPVARPPVGRPGGFRGRRF